MPFGPFLDKTDGITLLANAQCITDIDHATTGIFLSKNGGAGAIRHQPVTPSVADAYGMMLVTLDATDTNTLGTLKRMFAKAATYLPLWDEFMVVSAQVWDSLFGADKLDVAVVEQANIDFGVLQKASLDAATPVVTVSDKTGFSGTVTAINNIDFPALMKTSLNAATPAGVQNIPADGSGFTTLGDARIANLDVAVSTRTTLGTGAVEKTYTVNDNLGFPLAGVEVEVRAANNIAAPLVAKDTTGDDGTVTFYLDAATTYYLWRKKSGYDFTNPDIEVTP